MKTRNAPGHYALEETEVMRLVNSLASNDGMARQRAREQLARIGKPAVEALIGALDDHREQVRWEAARTLIAIADVRAAPALVRHLQDKVFDVRWLAAEALISLQEDALPALLEALERHSDKVLLREGAHHVLRELKNGRVAVIVKPVIDALDRSVPEITVPFAARSAMRALQS